MCGRKGFGLHLACVHFIRGRYPDWCETDFTLGNLSPIHQQAMQVVPGFGQNNANPMRYTELEYPRWAMGASLTQRRRVRDEGLRVVNLFQ